MLPFTHKVLKMLRLTVTIIITLGLSLCRGFTLELTPSFVGTRVTERVVLTCLYGGRTSIDGSIKNMRILKESESERWELMAEIEANKTNVNTSDNNGSASGLIGKLNDSFLTVSWPVASEDIPDRYRCEVVGFTSGGDSVWEVTEDIFVSERNFMLQSVLKIIQDEKENNKRELAAMRDRILKTVVTFIEKEKEIRKQEFSAIKKIINDTYCGKITQCSIGLEGRSTRNLSIGLEGSSTNLSIGLEGSTTNLSIGLEGSTTNLSIGLDGRSTTNLPKSVDQSLEKNDSLTTEAALTTKPEKIQSWPSGSFGLMSTSSGCPSNEGEAWFTGYRRHHTESFGVNHNKVSLINHLMKPLYNDSDKQKFMYQHFCLTNSVKENDLWPNGSYCINKYGKSCPLAFGTGVISWDDEDTNSASSMSGSQPLGMHSQSYTILHYCCRSDGLAISPIYLPNKKPFYLYRYGGTCQSVVGMRVSEEFMLFDTENSNNRDRYTFQFHPDGKANNDVQLILCYYEPILNNLRTSDLIV